MESQKVKPTKAESSLVIARVGGQVVEGGGAGDGEVEDVGQKVQTSTYKMKSVLGV